MTIEEALQLIEALRQELTSTQRALMECTAIIERQKAEIAELKRRLNQNSSNSSKPSSSDGLRKAKRKNRSLRKASGKKPGGQPGHSGKTMSLPHKPDTVLHCQPSKCLACPKLGKCKQDVLETRYEIDLEIRQKVTAWKQMGSLCPLDGNRLVQGEFPEGIRATKQYGPMLRTIAVALNTEGAVSIKKSQRILSALAGQNVSTGWVQNVVSSCHDKLQEVLKWIKAQLRREEYAHFDETGIRVNGRIAWVHNASTKYLTLQTVDWKRGQEGIRHAGILPGWHGVAIHDFFSPYWKYEAQHAVCCAHLLRECKGQQEAHPDGVFFRMFPFLLMKMKASKEKWMERGKEAPEKRRREEFMLVYDRVIELGEEEFPLPEPTPGKKGRPKKGAARSFIDRMKNHKEEVCRFFLDFRVPFDNNQAERDVRHFKVKIKVAGCFRTFEGAENFAALQSFLGTAKKAGMDAIQALKYMFTGQPLLALTSRAGE